MEKIEYRVRPVTRYIVTRHYECPNPPEMKGIDRKETKQIGGEHADANVAFQIAYALCQAEHERLGWPLDDSRIQYPTNPKESGASYAAAISAEAMREGAYLDGAAMIDSTRHRER